MRTSEIAGCYGRKDHFDVKQIINYDKYQENGRHIIRKCEILKQRVFLDRKNLTQMIRREASIRRTERYETTKSGEHGEETAHHQTSHTATQDVQNCGTSRTGCLET